MRGLVLAILLCLSPIVGLANWVVRGGNTGSESLDGAAIEVKGLTRPVTVLYDEHGVPYIEAQSDDDLYFAQGYVVARDRLWQMDLLRRTSRGQLAEIFGGLVLEEDKVQRRYGFAQLADQIVPRLDPKVRAALEAYTRGVNAYIASLNDDSLPVEFRLLSYKPTPWLPSDCVILGKLFAETLSDSWNYDVVRAAFAGVPEEKRRQIFATKSPMDVILFGSDEPKPSTRHGSKASASPPKRAKTRPKQHSPPAQFTPSDSMIRQASAMLKLEQKSLARAGLLANSLAASNNWVVNGQHSETGKPLLANDPHLPPSAPSIWYMISLAAPGFHCEGVTAPGAPGVFIGHNDRIAWGITNVVADVQDLFLEKFDESKPGQYLTPDGWVAAQVRREDINVRKAPNDPATRTVSLDVTVTRHGPIVLDKNGERYALSWPALDPTTKELEVYYNIDRAQSCQGMERALAHYTGAPLNFGYADVDGHIGWWAQGRYPIRKTGNGDVPQQGWTGAGDWAGYIPALETPHISDPRSGIIVTANNRTVGSTYQYYLGDLWPEPYRARRIYDLVTSKNKLSVADFERIQGDIYTIPGAIFASEAVKMARRFEGSPDWAPVLAEFKDWDANARSGSRPMLVAVLMRQAFVNRILESAFGEKLAKEYSWTSYIFFDEIVQQQPAEWLPAAYKSYADLLLACYRQALEDSKKLLGSDESKWQWGELARVAFPHPLAGAPLIGSQFNIPAFPENGSPYTVNNGSMVSMRFIADLSNWDNSRLGITLGESGDPRSPHWKDQLDDWRAVKPAILPFDHKTVETASRGKLLMKPAG